MYKIQSRENNSFDIVSICCVAFCIILAVFVTINISILQTSDVKKTISEYINNVIVVEVTTTGGETVKGSAVIISKNRAISVAHLFEYPAESIVGYSYDKQKTFELSLIDCDESKDLAILSIDANNVKFKTLKFASKTQVFYGDEIVKIGNALGYGLSVDTGIVSNPYQKLEVDDTTRELIQISINIRNGDSGGAVFKTNGDFIGLISFKTNTGISASDGLSYIVPAFVIRAYIN